MDCSINRLGLTDRVSPYSNAREGSHYPIQFVSDDDGIRYDIAMAGSNSASSAERQASPSPCQPPLRLEKAGPRPRIFFDPGRTRAAIVTCGGLCPGLNDVIRAIVMSLTYHYNVESILGIRYGYQGLIPHLSAETPPIRLTPEVVAGIHQQGGTILGSSRGHGDQVKAIVDTLERQTINILFTIGGDGTQRGALAIADEISHRQLPIAVVGIPKTIDNDLSFVQRSFGFETAVATAVQATAGAHVEATSAINGIGLVKVMGRQSGFIAAHTALADNNVNAVLVPEVPFELEGKGGLLSWLTNRLQRRGHALIVVAEGAGQSQLQASNATDASGNARLGDIGLFLKERIKAHFDGIGTEINLKYLDPSYLIRSTPANADDSIYCARLGAHAVHAAMTGRTALVIGLVHNVYVHVPIQLTVSRRNVIDPAGELWRDVIGATGQPLFQ